MKDEKQVEIKNINVYKKVLNVLFTQVSAKEGIRRWGDEAIAPIVKELKQLQDGAMPGRPVIEPVKYEELSEDDKENNTLEAVTVAKQKRCGKLNEELMQMGADREVF